MGLQPCIFCGKKTSFVYEGEGEYHHKPVCPSCQATHFKTNFNSGCNTDDGGVCAIRLNAEEDKK